MRGGSVLRAETAEPQGEVLRLMQSMGRTGRTAMIAASVAVLAVACESPTKPPPAVGSVLLSPGAVALASGDSVQMSVVVRDPNGNTLNGRTLVFTVNNTELLAVSATGMVRALSNRTNAGVSARVAVSVDGVSDDSEIIVQPVAAATLTLAPLDSALAEGQSATIAFEARDAEGGLLSGRQPEWVSRDTTLVRVNAVGELQPRPFIAPTPRSTYVVATLGAAKDSIEVAVSPSVLASLTILPQQPVLRNGYSKRLRVIATTANGQQVSGLEATYTSSNTSVATTAAAGVLTAATSGSGVSTIVASYGSAADTVTLTVDACGAGATGTYPIDLRNVGPGLSAEVQAAFTCASARIRTLIRSGISRVDFTSNYTTAPRCFSYTVNAGTSTTGVIILMRVGPIDGVGGTLGRAGPCDVRSTSLLAVIGLMEFDEADIAKLVSDGTLVEVILHEMLHVVGIGPTWRDPAFIPSLYTGDVADPAFFGTRATRECRVEHGGNTTCATQVPVEDCVGIAGCGDGTRYGHWRELVFDHELMTGYIDVPRSPLSRMTIAALGDLGYSVDLDQAEDYLLPTQNLMAGLVLKPQNLRLGLRLPDPVRPTRSVDANGRARPILQ